MQIRDTLIDEYIKLLILCTQNTHKLEQIMQYAVDNNLPITLKELSMNDLYYYAAKFNEKELKEVEIEPESIK